MNIIVIPWAERRISDVGGEKIVSRSPHTGHEKMVMDWEYSTDLFDDATIARMMMHYRVLLENIVVDPSQHISELPLLTEQEQFQLLVEWNDTQVDYPRDACIQQLFEAQVQQSPDAIAVVFGEEQSTYRELNRRANQLAHYLQEFGVRSDTLVGICVERSPEMVVGILGILKAGGAYLPLDPTYPKERLSFMLTDAQVPLLVTQLSLTESLPDHESVVYLDFDWHTISHQSEVNPVSDTRSEHLAYCIYTSGSTGQPKGVSVPHQGLLNLVSWHQSAFEVTEDDRASQLAVTSFDAAVWEVWPYLAAGASLQLVAPGISTNPETVCNWLISEKITISFLPTPLAEHVLALDWPKDLALRTLLTGGDRLHYYPAASFPFEVINNYGPTENTVVATSGTVLSDGRVGLAPPIGRPISNTQVYLLDSHLNPVPIGVPGELYIGGASLARGYLNRPELTAEQFISNPFSDCSGTRLYNSGDLVRRLNDGNIEFLRRVDNQIKIRGFRVELGEIEMVLGYHLAVKQVIVLVQENDDGDKRLIAYILPTSEESPTISQLRGFLKEKLPDYMIPTDFVFLDVLPLTPSGKVDRSALPAPDLRTSQLEENHVLPRTPLEETLANIWLAVLKREQMGIHSSFFDSGGHSLLATQVVSRVRDTFQVDISLRRFFQDPTVAGLAVAIEELLIEEVEGLTEEEAERFV